jgi:hypothetical protein
MPNLNPLRIMRGLRALLSSREPRRRFGAWVAGAALVSQVQAAPGAGLGFEMFAVPDPSAKASRQVVAATGATIAATGRDGTVFRLTIPPKALAMDTLVTLTPLTRIQGVPGQAAHHGVDISPAGTRLLAFATLEITPAVPLPRPLYWLEHTGSPTRPVGRPGFPARGASAMLVSHFSGGSVVGASQATFDAMHPTAPAAGVHGTGSTGWLEWQRNIVEQDYRNRAIDSVTYETRMGIITNRLLEASWDDLLRQVEQAQEHALQMANESEVIAARGRLEDMDALSQNLVTLINAERTAALLNLPSRLDPFKPLITYFDALVSRCESQFVPPVAFINLAHQVALLSHEISMSDLTRCVCAGPERPANLCAASYDTQGTFGEVAVSGTVCDLRRPFRLQGTTPGGTLTWNFDPSSPSTGQYRYTGSVTREGFAIAARGEGSYAVVGGDRPRSITLQGSGCASAAGCAADRQRITLNKREQPCPP